MLFPSMTLILSKNPDEPEFSLSLSGRLDDMLPGDTYLANLSNIYFQFGRGVLGTFLLTPMTSLC